MTHANTQHQSYHVPPMRGGPMGGGPMGGGRTHAGHDARR